MCSLLRVSILIYFGILVALLIEAPNFAHNQSKEDIKALKALNNKTASTLQELVKQKYFRIIRLNLNSECPLPYMNKICKSKSCAVCRCDERDIPQSWSSTDKVLSQSQDKDVWS